MSIDANDLLTGIRNQRNAALDEAAKLYAHIQAQARRIKELEEEIEKMKKPK